jgi:hypothetical protein
MSSENDGRRHHDPNEGETRYPPQEGEQRGPHRRGERDPHEPAATPVDDLPARAPGQQPQTDGMGTRPPARGERVSSRKMPPERD